MSPLEKLNESYRVFGIKCYVYPYKGNVAKLKKFLIRVVVKT